MAKYPRWRAVLLDEEGREIKAPAIYGGGPAGNIFSLSFERHFDFSSIHGMTGADSILILREAVQKLGTEGIPNYWVANPGNVGVACARLAKWAEQHPNARWDVSNK